MKKWIILLLIAIPVALSAQEFEKVYQTGEEIKDYCYIHHVILKNASGYSFVVTNMYNSDMTSMIPLVVISNEKPNTEDLSCYQLFYTDEAVIVRDYLVSLKESYDSHPKGITRVFNGPHGVQIKAVDTGSGYRVFFNCVSRHSQNVYFKREIEEWISGFDKCLSFIEKQGSLGLE